MEYRKEQITSLILRDVSGEGVFALRHQEIAPRDHSLPYNHRPIQPSNVTSADASCMHVTIPVPRRTLHCKQSEKYPLAG
jgi:hypothetical protein